MRTERAAIDAPDRQAAAAVLGQFMRRMMVQVAIADLLDRLSVGETALAMSELADECIRTALDLATPLSRRPRARDRPLLRAGDGQAWRARTQPQLGR